MKYRLICIMFCALALGTLRPGMAVERPNILHIHADDHRSDGLAALGTTILKTPHLDQLVKRGTTFTCCYTQGSMIGAVCLPSRTMMLTGKSLFRIGARGDTAGVALPTLLGDAGYQTWHMGKGGNEYKAGIEAFQTNLVDEGRGDLRATSSERLANSTLSFLKERAKDRPFYVYLAPPVPHDPRVAPPEFHAMYRAADIPLSKAFMPLHPWDNGDMRVRDETLAPWPRTPEDTQRQLAEYYACITCLDFHVGRVLNHLNETGELKNTIVVFSADNGLSMGEHGLFGKQNLYEFGGMHVPLVFAGPGIPVAKTGALAYLMDLTPTFCDFAGVSPPANISGKSLRGVIEKKSEKVRDVLYTAYTHSQRAIRNDQWKLIRYPLVNKTQLFDLKADPQELTNLAEEPKFAAKVSEMLALLQQEMDDFGDRTPLSIPDPKPAEWTPPNRSQEKPKRKAN